MGRQGPNNQASNMSASSTSTIPTFDLQALKQGAEWDALRRCLTEKGVFLLTGCVVLEDDHSAARRVALQFFENGTSGQKAAVSSPDAKARRGFTGLESESTASITNSGSYTDYSMCYSMGTSGNLFPDGDFQAAWEDYFGRLHAAARELSQVILDIVGAEPAALGESHKATLLDGEPVLRLRYFPEVPPHRVAEAEPLRMAPHYDVSLVTLIHQTPCPNGFVSLQCQVDGKYEDVPAATGTLLVLCGAIATIVSEGKVRAPMHRVVAPSRDQQEGSGRTSSVFFLRPKPEFEFDLPKAKAYGFNISLDGQRTTFGEWMGGNYANLRTK
jgi:deacetoxycephalosporin-C synthase/deacetoxycephalosporin-C hydroxylase